MDTAFEDKMAQLTELTDLFERNKKQYHSSQYDEANTRTDFIDKFFELLGWDVRNEQGYSEQYREVIREDKVTIGGVRKFFVEAKKLDKSRNYFSKNRSNSCFARIFTVFERLQDYSQFVNMDAYSFSFSVFSSSYKFPICRIWNNRSK